jgi:predicted lipoprotein with Yx(FWY)xxD motif
VAAPATVSAATGELGSYLVDGSGRTLYYFTQDVTPGVSVCGEGCAEAWPPLISPDGSVSAGEDVPGTLAVTPRSDGSLQVTYRGRPLYTFSGDQAAGDVNGQGLNGVWFVASLDGSVPVAPEGEPQLTLGSATTDLGTFLIDPAGQTLYVFTVDTSPGVSTCEGDCAATWPPLVVETGAVVAGDEGVPGVIGLFARSDGTTQVSYDGRPLYYFAGDTGAGQTNGQGIGGVWFVADVSGSPPS